MSKDDVLDLSMSNAHINLIEAAMAVAYVRASLAIVNFMKENDSLSSDQVMALVKLANEVSDLPCEQ